ncbi:YbhB/YbcL family Raf kinase inhibitor-like protein [Geomonas nitrogeniifigens]|uniref:YbhB/YbcL family Raf kinase inhibitor-like protein n=1 Tax=Geomonas diazotrophica TaxID=2843197 RepID=A0ABX8JTL2_9BACT|nr:YbhB/YbcL family Raf kinase inhibitor-like protein [Geomonas nitrogeniifigens]
MGGVKTISLWLILLTAFVAVSVQAEEVRLKLSSPAFKHAGKIPSLYSCDGSDTSPPLAIAGVPKEAKSLALVMDDPDAPAGTWVHWVLWNIEPTTREIVQGRVPHGAEQGVNSWRRKSYGGPCPPSGQHRYYFRLYALSERLDLPSNSTRLELDRAMRGKILAQAELLGVFAHR